MSMRIAFMGTPDFSVPILAEIIAAGHDVVAVYSQPPRQAGRGMEPTPSPVHKFANENGIDVRTPLNFKDPQDRADFAALGIDLAVVVAYGLILPQELLDAPVHGCINVHASLLPRWRGAAPIQRAIMAGDTETGCMIMQMEAGLDTGPVLLAEHVSIGPDTTAALLHDELSQVGASMITRILPAIERGGVVPTPQSEEGVTYADKIYKAETRIDWTRTAEDLDCHIRGLSPFPGAWCEISRKGKSGPVVERLKILLAQPKDNPEGAEPGSVINNKLTIACGEGALHLRMVQRAGKGPVNSHAFLRGFPLDTGDKVD